MSDNIGLHYEFLKETAFSLILRANFYPWTVQGFGMLRLPMGKDYRLQIWSNSLRTPNVSDIHDHPWGFESCIVAGRLLNTRFKETSIGDPAGRFFNSQSLIPGPNGGLIGNKSVIGLRAEGLEGYDAGAIYRQEAKEIHRTAFDDGTVTIIRRTPVPPTEDRARVFWERGDWVDAQPRTATMLEVDTAVRQALKWFL